MKILVSSLLTLTLSQLAFAGSGYSSNDGKTAPGNFSSKSTKVTKIIEREESAPTAASQTGVRTGSGVTTEKMNTSANPAPATDKEVIDNTTLSKDEAQKTGPFTEKTEYNYKKEVQSQEETPMDYSTTPEKRPRLQD